MRVRDRPTTYHDYFHREVDIFDSLGREIAHAFASHTNYYRHRSVGPWIDMWVDRVVQGGGCAQIPCPQWVWQAWYDGAPVEPLLDYLLESSPEYAPIIGVFIRLLAEARVAV